MIGALWTGISGLSSQQQALDNESNNIANVNTVGFKSSRISFADQMYQDRIGKGSKILDAEKLYVQGNLKLTGVSYDMALSGEGFFSVANTRTSGTSEVLYTRAGNFRMGDNGTLQDAAGNEVQGWMMSPIDTANDVVSTNPNASVFTNDYSKLLNSKVIRHGTYVETITAKATDYTSTAKSDSESVFSGAGMKTKASKISDIEAAIADYSNWLQRLKDEPDGASATSIAQVAQINFKSGNDGLISKDGDQLYVYIDGNKISQNYVPTTADDDFITSLLDTANTTAITVTGAGPYTSTSTVEDNTRYSITVGAETVYYDSTSSATAADIVSGINAAITANGTISGVTASVDGSGDIQIDSTTAAYSGTTTPSVAEEDYDIAASRIATYKALADKISEIAGLSAYMVSESDAVGIEANDVLQLDESFAMSTNNLDMYKGMIQIKSLIPGEEFVISEIAEVSGSSSIQGNFQTQVAAEAGEGIGALETSRDALSRLVTGKQQDVYTVSDLGLAADGSLARDFTYGITIYDNELGATVPIPNDGGTPPEPLTILIDGATSIDDIVAAINDNTLTTFTSNNGTPSIVTNNMPDHIIAKNVNGNLVIETLDDNYDVEFTGALKVSADVSAPDAYGSALTADYTPIDKNNNYSGRQGAGAEFIEIINKVDQTASKGSLQLRLDTLGISDSAFGEFSVDSTGLITMKQDGAEFAIGQVAIALFNNNRGLEPVGDNLLSKTTESGEPIYNLNNDKTAKVEAQTLELSTADLSESLVNLMVFQRAFEANAKSITTSDELLNTLINLKR